MGISSALQRLIVARLKAEVPLVSGRVFDGPNETATMPYVSIGPSYWNDDSAECIRGRVETVQVDIWASNKPDKRAAKDATDEVVAALDGWEDTAALTMHPLRVSLVRVMDDPAPGVIHGVVQVEAMVEG
ncbi:DUF3168 domain-containing protein [Paracoccus suum]|uniref:DUF3168 domain-containing protein n=1 Tax=Paracoccus suum TaxID=2259340 RepID=A0A344PL07_9RHOB|nr:DUF3168 domain-containing protein [Paracoccus suum]AXC50062.1 DUF3168 domain-containing protein [Paracoccus suum]